LLIFPGGTSVIRHATHGVIYASRSYEREHDHWTRITRFDPLLPRLLPRPSPRSRLISTLSHLSVLIFRELSHSSCAESEKSNEVLVGSNVYRSRDPWRTRYVNLPGGTRGLFWTESHPGWSGVLSEFLNDLVTCHDRHGCKSEDSVRFLTH